MFKDSQVFSGFSVNDLSQAKEFYSQKLGLEIDDQDNMGFSLKFAMGGSAFVYSKPDHVPATFTILNFTVDDIDKAVADLMALGITFEKYPNMGQDDKGVARPSNPADGPNIAWFKDPAGNILAVLQEVTAS